MQTRSIHIGLNHVDRNKYNGWTGTLRSCEADARSMEALAAEQGISNRVLLLSADATYAPVMDELKAAATVLRDGDYLLITFAGHGASYDDIPTPASLSAAARPEESEDSNAGDEPDRRDEAWVLYDTYLLDDELHDYFVGLPPGVCVCVVSDSCFSGTVTRDGEVKDGRPALPGLVVVRGDGPPAETERRMDPRLANALYRRRFVAEYLPRIATVVPSRPKRPGAHVVLLAACQDNQTAGEGPGHGLFTEKLLEIWRAGQSRGSHRELIEGLKRVMPRRQQPNLYISGAPNARFENAPPFTPGAPVA
jgi:hypothetical protein